MAAIPSIIHFVWLSKQVELPTENITTMIKWVVDNPSFTVMLWLDTAFSGSDIESSSQIITTQLAHQLAASSLSEALLSNFKIHDIRQSGIATENDNIIDYELGKLVPNYGASSDMVRYRVLYHYGGAYFDFDVIPASKLTDCLTSNEPAEHVFYADHLRQQNIAAITAEQYTSFSYDWSNFGNDSLICTKHNPVLKAIMDQVEQVNYQLDGAQHRELIYRRAYFSRNIREMTVHGAGPGVGRVILPTLPVQKPFINDDRTQGYTTEYQQRQSLIKPIKMPDCHLSKPLITYGERTNVAMYNARTWIRVAVNYAAYANIQAVKDTILTTIAYEQHNFRICRMDDHWQDYVAAIAYYGLEVEHYGDDFFNAVEQLIDPDKIKAVQRISGEPVVEAFYTRLNLTEKSGLNDASLVGSIIEWVMAFELLTSKAFKKHNMMMKNPKLFENILRDAYRETESLLLVNKIIQGIQFIRFIKTQGISEVGYPSLDFLKILLAYQRILTQGYNVFKELVDEQQLNTLLQELDNYLSEDFSTVTYLFLNISDKWQQMVSTK